MYPNDITREQFEMIRKDLEGARKATHPRKYDLYDGKRRLYMESYPT